MSRPRLEFTFAESMRTSARRSADSHAAACTILDTLEAEIEYGTGVSAPGAGIAIRAARLLLAESGTLAAYVVGECDFAERIEKLRGGQG